MNMSPISKISRFYLGSFILITIIVIAGIGVFRTSASNEFDENPTVRLKSQNTTTVNLRPGRDLPTSYDSVDDSSYQIKGAQNHPLALASADFDVDGFPDLVTGYSTPSGGGVLTFHKGNAEAFAPQSEKSFALIKDGRFPNPFIEKAESFAIPAAPDFLVSGDFDRDGNLDVITATRGGRQLFLFSGKGTDGGFNAPQTIELAGRVSALTAGEIDASDNRADLLVGVDGDSGAALLVFENAERGVFASPLQYKLQASAISLGIGKLDDDSWMDTAILTDYGVFVLHGFNQRAVGKAAKNSASRMEQINLPFVPQALAIGDFVWDRAGKTEIALLAQDGTVQIARRGELDERPFSVEETRLKRRQNLETRMRGGGGVEELKDWQIGTSENWTVSDSVDVGASVNRQNTAAPVLMRANLSGQNTDDILLLDSQTGEVKILYTQEPEKQGDEAVSFAGERAVYSLEATSEPMAMLSMPLNIFVRPGLVILQDGKTVPSFVPSAPTGIYNVDRTDDTNVAAAQGCTAAGNDCSLRGAITKANGASGADTIIVPAGTYTLTLANPGSPNNNDDANATGDLDILDSITITGAGQATTIIQAGTTNANGIDKVFASNPICTSTVNTSMSGLTVRYGRNTQPFNAADFSFTGGGLDWCNDGSGAALTVTNSTFDSNTVMNGYGGGIDLSPAPTITSGLVTLTGVTLSNNATGANLANRGGGLSSDGGPYSITITNSTISGNTTPGAGAGIYINHNVGAASNNDVFQLHGITVSGNMAGNLGGGINAATYGPQNFTLDQKSVVSGNTSGTATGTGSSARGGGMSLTTIGTGTITVTKTNVLNNTLSPNAANNQGGAGIAVSSSAGSSFTLIYNRIFGNSGTPAAMGTGLYQDLSAGNVDARNNWWGCNTGPSAAPCDTAVIGAGSLGTLQTNPWLRFTHTASPSTIVVGQNSTLTASFLTNSAGTAIAASNLDVLIGLPVTFNNAVRGTISNAQATIQASGTATATFTGTAVGAGSADAKVDNGTATANLTINQATTTTTVTSSANPSAFGQSVSFTATVTAVAPGGGTPTGTVQFVVDGTNFGATVALSGSGTATSNSTTTLTIGNHTVTANFIGSTNYAASSGSLSGGQQVNKANTTTTITSDNPDPSVRGQTITVNYTVAVTAPGMGTPTGNVTVSDGVNSCMAAAAAGSCNVALTTVGNRTLTATYAGDANFSGSTSADEPHTVNKANTTTTINSNTPNPSMQNAAVVVTYSVAVTAPGTGTPTGTVTVSDGVDSCTASVATGSCMITLTTSGMRTLTATYSGDGNFNTSVSAGVSQTVTIVTAAPGEVSGRVMTNSGRAISNARVTITDQAGNSRLATTSAFGYFRFDDVQTGETYIISVTSKRYSFAPQVVNLTENLTDLNFIAVQ